MNNSGLEDKIRKNELKLLKKKELNERHKKIQKQKPVTIRTVYTLPLKRLAAIFCNCQSCFASPYLQQQNVADILYLKRKFFKAMLKLFDK